MFNKLSFLPSESLYPVCCLALDDFEDGNGNVNIDNEPLVADIVDTDDVIGHRINLDKLIVKLCAGTLNETEEKDLLTLLKGENGYSKEIPCERIADIYKTMGIDEDDVNNLGTKIQLRVVAEDNMPYYNSKPDCLYNITDFPTEYYGYYDSYNSEIILCPERISNAPAESQKQHRHITSRELYVVVLVHALAHVLMDPTKTESNKFQPLIRTVNGFSEREVLMEESLVNMLTLRYFDKLRKPEVVRYGEVREFIELQSLPYNFGLYQHDILKPDWRLWREAKRNTKFIKDK